MPSLPDVELDGLFGSGGAAREVEQLPGVVREVGESVFEHDDFGISAETAYNALLGFFPFLLFLGSVLSAFSWLIEKDTLIEQLAGQVQGTAPDDVSTTFQRVLDDLLSKGGVAIGIIGAGFALWSGSNAVASLIKGLNRIHGSARESGLMEERLEGLGFLGLFFLAFVTAQILVVGSSYLSEEVGLALGAPIEFAAWILAFLVTAASVGLFYRWAPAERHEDTSVISIGALVFAVSWLIFMAVYTIYLTLSRGPTSALGIIGFVILLMVWFFWTAFSILLGAEVDHRLGTRSQRAREAVPVQG